MGLAKTETLLTVDEYLALERSRMSAKRRSA
jgi:hypothetical protein